MSRDWAQSTGELHHPARPSERRHSVFALHDPAALRWPALLDAGGQPWLHVTGITPLISAAARQSWDAALRQAGARETARTRPARLGPARLGPARLGPARLGPSVVSPTRGESPWIGASHGLASQEGGAVRT